MNPKLEKIIDRTKWFRHDRFGLFIHWGLYSIPACGEWVRSNKLITKEDYYKYFKRFNPKNYNPDEWAEIAYNAGMRYAVLTAKHHDGFCLFDSKLTDFKSTNTACKRDLVKEFLEAFRKKGIKVGLYYSLLDWHHDDYPHSTDERHPMRGNPDYPDDKRDFNRYLDYMHAQIKELCTEYGKLDIMWFDFSYGELRGEKWRATELIKMVRSYQPDVIIDNRLEVSGEGFGSLFTDSPTDYCGDFVCPEQIIPPSPIKNFSGDYLPWESCITINNNWGYNNFDKDYKSSALIVRTLVNCVSKGGNLLLNVGPDANGNFPQKAKEVLAEVGYWMSANSESIYGAGLAEGLEKPEYGRFTAKANKLYVHVTEDVIGPLPIPTKILQDKKLVSVKFLADGSELHFDRDFTTANYPELNFIALGEVGYFTYPVPDKTDTVIELTFED